MDTHLLPPRFAAMVLAGYLALVLGDAGDLGIIDPLITVTDRRRIDPDTGQVRSDASPSPAKKGKAGVDNPEPDNRPA